MPASTRQKRTNGSCTTKAAAAASPLDDLPALIARTNIHFQALVERTLAELKLDRLLRPGMAPVLFALYEKDGCIIKDLAGRTQRSAAALNSLLGRLEKSGVVNLRTCAQDGRAVRVRLTAKGREMEPRVRELHRRVVAAVEQGLTAEEAAQAATLLQRIIAGITQEEQRQNSLPATQPTR
ncbi:MarR family winged helix-turn-helix transcriptional regulator [Prosthecobacter sp.]|uniref:MarR family winged helix-turn-helix transcriptional regulator n=1 Tax=Prosthecobacter sp. TaxID=1965333 RepID=UPI003784EAD6